MKLPRDDNDCPRALALYAVPRIAATGPVKHLAPPKAAMDERALEDYLLLVLSDSNLPTGGFVASSGLESWLQHGYAATSAPPPASASDLPEATDPAPRQSGTDSAIKAFVGQSLDSYTRLNAPLLRRAHATVKQLRSAGRSTSTSSSAEQREEPVETDCTLADILATDALCETMTLNHVARRASVAQGVALLTLYDRAFAPPPRSDEARRSAAVIQLVAEYRSAVKSGKESANGHMSVAFGVLTAAIGISIGKQSSMPEQAATTLECLRPVLGIITAAS